MTKNEDTGDRTGSAAFEQIGTALREIATIVSRLEDTALRPFLYPADVSQKTKSLQDFDLVLQSLADLADLMDKMSEGPSAEMIPDCATPIAQMRLAWLRDLIGQNTTVVDHQTSHIAIF